MQILFLTVLSIKTLEERSIYTDLLREFRQHGHTLTVLSPCDEAEPSTHTLAEDACRIIRVKTGKLQKQSNFIKKGIATVLLERQYIAALKAMTADTRFDMVLYSTPPITLQKAVSYIKRRDGAKTYLLLKDIWPQGILDVGALSAHGWRGIITRYFRRKERALYADSDYIGCMSPANVAYLRKHEPQLPPDRIEVCPNSLAPCPVVPFTQEQRSALRAKYEIPADKTIFVYGGNLGIPQGIPFVMEAITACAKLSEAYFLIAGDGTQFTVLADCIREKQLQNVKLLKQLPRQEYENLMQICDAGLIFLDHRYTIPNYPSRLLSYMQAGIPVLCATDPNTDVGSIAMENGYGLWCESNDADAFLEHVRALCSAALRAHMGENARRFFMAQYTAAHSYDIIMKHFVREENAHV